MHFRVLTLCRRSSPVPRDLCEVLCPTPTIGYMEFTVNMIAAMLGGQVKGDGSGKIRSFAKIEAGEPGAISFLANEKYEPFIYETRSTAVIVNASFQPRKEIAATLIVVQDAYAAFAQLMTEYQRIVAQALTGIEQPSYIDPSAQYGQGLYLGAFAYVGKQVRIGQNVKIHPQAYIGDRCVIGDHTVIHPGVRIYADTQIGSHCKIHAGCVIGSDGFGYAPQADGSYKAIPQIGHVILEDAVEIGANTVIDRATMGATVIGQGTKLDNLIQIGHNVRIGRHTVIAAQTGVAGSTEIGDYCRIGGQAGFNGHIKIANRTSVGAQSGVQHDVKEEGLEFFGSPAFDLRAFFRSMIIFRRLPELSRRLDQLEKKFNARG